MGKTILGKVNGWTPVINTIVKDTGLMSAVVFGRMWRFCQMEDGVCKASLEKISEEIGIDRATVMRHAKDLCAAGYLKDLTPDLRNRPHVYADTGKASLEINLTVAENNTGALSVAESNSTLQKVIPTVAESKLNKVSKKETEDIIKSANKKVDAILANELVVKEKLEKRETWPHREKFPDALRELLDVFVKLTGQHPSSGRVMDWLSSAQDWLDLGIIADDLQKAYVRSKGINGTGGFPVARPGSLTNVANMYAGERRTNGNGSRPSIDYSAIEETKKMLAEKWSINDKSRVENTV